MAKGALTILRKRNEAQLLNHLRLGTAYMRSGLARSTGLDAKTITNLVKSLLAKRLIVKTGLRDPSGGRPTERLALNPDGAYAIGVDLGATRLRTVLVDLAGQLRSSSDTKLIAPDNSKKILRQITRSIRHTVERAKLRSCRWVIGIGFACPGFLDRQTGIAQEAVNIPGWKNVPVSQYLGKEFSVPVSLEESSRAMALGELWFGLGRQTKDFISLDLGFGIGVGIVTDGRLHHGVSESGGEIGHTAVKRNGLPCRCGHRGCLETVASGSAIARRLDCPSSMIAAKNAQTGDRKARAVITEAGTCLGVAAANLVNLLNPGLIILNGGLCRMGELLLAPFRRALKQHALARSMEVLQIEKSQLGDLAGAMGAATLPLRTFFEIE